MSEKEKMLAQEWYDANYDNQLLEERKQAQQLCFEFQHTPPQDKEATLRILKQLFPHMDTSATILSPIYCDYGIHCHIGKESFLNHNCYLMDSAPITIGDHVFIGPNCGLYTSTHPMDVRKRNEGFERAFPITIEDNVWIGGNVCILAGVTIGEGSVIGAGSVVTHDIPSHVVAVGNPCRILRSLL